MSTEHLITFLEGLKEPRVLVVGDVIMDRYVFGEVKRISPEAPIPVLNVDQAELRLGGAGNVAANLRAMGAAVSIASVVGSDSWGEDLAALLVEAGVDVTGLVTDEDRPTVRKSRLMSGVQQILRVDWEESAAVEGDAAAAIRAHAAALLEGVDAVVLSDYGKGVLTNETCAHVLGLAKERGVPVVVDPKGEDYSKYRGATLVSPNRNEAELALVQRALPDALVVADPARRVRRVNPAFSRLFGYTPEDVVGGSAGI